MIVFEVLAAQGRSLTWLAAQLGVHRSLLTHYKAGRRRMPYATAARAASILGIPESLIRDTKPDTHVPDEQVLA